MVFNSINYLLFLIAVVTLYYLTPHKWRWLLLLATGIFFYASFVPAFLWVMLAVILLNYFAGIGIDKYEGQLRKRIYLAGIIGNIAILAFFKYANFLQISFQDLASRFDLHYPEQVLNILLPLGLSFISFTAISYLIEIKRKKIKAEHHIGHFINYLMFFPKVMQGPIERPQLFIPQLKEVHVFDYDQIVEGLKQMVWGYFKKLVVADRLAIYVNAVYGNVDQHHGLTFILATFFYAFQIYADFSGYTDIALGSAKLMGFRLTNNFNRPYFATSVKDFWNRWHISLSTWLRDYLFLPLAYYFSRKMPNTKYFGLKTDKWIYIFATLITFTICGIWHGEGITYLIWGLTLGVYLSFAKLIDQLSKNALKAVSLKKSSTVIGLFNILITFFLIVTTWGVFRSNNFKDIFTILNVINTKLGVFFLDKTTVTYGFLGIGFLFTIDIIGEFYNNIRINRLLRNRLWLNISYAMLLVLILALEVLDGGQFIYFQF